MPCVETHFDPTAVHNLARHSSKRLAHDMFADYDLSPLCSAHPFTVIPLLFSEPTQPRSNHRACSTQWVSTHSRGLCSCAHQLRVRIWKETSASRQQGITRQSPFSKWLPTLAGPLCLPGKLQWEYLQTNEKRKFVSFQIMHNSFWQHIAHSKCNKCKRVRATFHLDIHCHPSQVFQTVSIQKFWRQGTHLNLWWP